MENRIITLLSELVQINSVNRTLSDGPGEREIAEFIAQRLKTQRLDAEIQNVGHNQRNVAAIITGKERSRSLLLNATGFTVAVPMI